MSHAGRETLALSEGQLSCGDDDDTDTSQCSRASSRADADNTDDARADSASQRQRLAALVAPAPS